MNVKSHSILFRVVSFIVCFSIFIGCCPTIFAENSGSIPVVKYKINGEILQATLINIGTFSDSEDTSIEMGNGTTGNVFLASLPEGAQVYQIIACITPNEDETGLKIPLNLQLCALGDGCHLHAAAGGERLGKGLGVLCVHCGKIVDVGQKDHRLDHVVHGKPRLGQNRFQVGKALCGLLLHGIGHGAGGGAPAKSSP